MSPDALSKKSPRDALKRVHAPVLSYETLPQVPSLFLPASPFLPYNLQ